MAIPFAFVSRAISVRLDTSAIGVAIFPLANIKLARGADLSAVPMALVIQKVPFIEVTRRMKLNTPATLSSPFVELALVLDS